MSKKVVIRSVLGVAVVLAVGGAATYVWLDYSQAQNALANARLDVRSLGENIERHPEDVPRLKEMCSLAKINLQCLETSASIWIDKAVVTALRVELEKDQRDIDQLAAAAEKRKSSGTFGGWIRPPTQ